MLAVLLNEQHKPAIIQATRGHDLQTPVSLDAEIGNALSALLKLNHLTLYDAEQILELYNQIPIRRTKLRLPEATKLVHTYHLYAYDAYLLDCARQ